MGGEVGGEEGRGRWREGRGGESEKERKDKSLYHKLIYKIKVFNKIFNIILIKLVNFICFLFYLNLIIIENSK